VGKCSEYQSKAVTPYGWRVRATVRVWVAGKTGWSPCYTQAICERFRDKGFIYKALYKFICLLCCLLEGTYGYILLCDCQGQYNFNKLYLVYVSCSCSCIHFFTCKSADSISLCMFLVICSNLITRKCCELNTALIGLLFTLIFLNR